MYDSRTDRRGTETWSSEFQHHYRTKQKKGLKRQTSRKYRRIPVGAEIPTMRRFGKRVFCYCCCTGVC